MHSYRFARPAYVAVLILVTMLWAATASATHPSPPPTTPDPVGVQAEADAAALAQAASYAGAASFAGAAQGQTQTASSDQRQGQQQALDAHNAQGQGQQQAASSDQQQSANNEGVQQGVEINQNYKQVRQTATAIAGTGNTTAGCRYVSGAGGQAPVIGLALNLNFKDKDCERLGLAQYLYGRGLDGAGDRVMCTITELRKTLGEDCLALVHVTVVVRVPPSAAEIERRKQERGFPGIK